MDKSSIKISAELIEDTIEVKAMIKHIMSSGLIKDKKSGKTAPANFIQEIRCAHNGSLVFSANIGPDISHNPYFSFRILDGMKNDDIVLSWVDNYGETDSQSVKVQ